ncbi:MAG: TonB-dependent receptor, partial [Bacteroidales bacterium]|nr:TonB-dependent receptor [Bacteroidales bacterium]
MIKRFSISILISFLLINFVSAQKTKTDANLIGHVLCEGVHTPFANISLKGTTIGTLTDGTGHYMLTHLPVGDYIVVASFVGYKTQEKPISLQSGVSLELNFDLEKDILGLDEVVVSGNRNAEKRVETPLIINSISPKIFANAQSQSLSEGLNFCSGLRLENNCQNCGFNSVRMNGMEGHYTQILINGRPIFSGLAGVYGLELIPSNIIERVEVIRGGGSAMYGGNAIAGTLNIILKDPVTNSYELGLTSGVIGLGMSDSIWGAPDISGSFNTSLVSDDFKTGMTLYGFSRRRGFFDANNDGISELSPLNNLTLGTRFYHRFGARSKLTFDFFNIMEERNGGNKLETIWHERDVSESVKHNIKASSLSLDQFFRKYDILQVFVAGQFLDRDSYYGANQDLAAYGKSKDRTFNMGAQYTADLGKSKLIFGFDNIHGNLYDKKMGYPDIENAVIQNDTILEIPHVDDNCVANQSSNTIGTFVQYEFKHGKLKFIAGSRFDSYKINNYEQSTTKTGNVFIPRVSLMYDVFDFLQARVGVSTGYRAPQIFDEDLHVETSGSRQVINVNDPLLKQENSYSGTFSLDMNKDFK